MYVQMQAQSTVLQRTPTMPTSPYIASYPGLLTPALVTCTTNVGEGLVKLITCNDVPGCWVDVWRSGTFPEIHK